MFFVKLIAALALVLALSDEGGLIDPNGGGAMDPNGTASNCTLDDGRGIDPNG